MPNIFLSPATYNNTVQAEDHSFEQELIHPLTDLLATGLKKSKVHCDRRADYMSDNDTVTFSNAGSYDLHLALHANMAPDCLSGALRGIRVLHAPNDLEGARCAEALAGRLKRVYPLSDQVFPEPCDAVEQLTGVSNPSVMLLLGYRDNAADAEWVQRERGAIAAAICQAIEAYLEVEAYTGEEDDIALQVTVSQAPLVEPRSPIRAKEKTSVPTLAPALYEGIVRAPFGGLVMREAPDSTSSILKTVENHSRVAVMEEFGAWCLLQAGDTIGYAKGNFIFPL